jgi:hypothetical protein
MTPVDVALRPDPEVISKRLEGVTVLVHIPTNRIFELNETGSRVWELLGQGLGVDRIVHHLVDEFQVDDVRAADEANGFLVRLRTAGLLGS